MDDNLNKHVSLAIPTNDGITIFPKMPGMVKCFIIYTTTDSRKFTLVEKRNNPFKKPCSI